MVACIVTGIILFKRATGFKYGESSMCVFQNVSKHLVCEKKKGLQSVNMKFSGPVLIEIKVMQTLFRLFWCTLLKTRLSSIFLWHSPFLTQKARLLSFLFLFLAESLIALKGSTIFSLFCLCPLLRAVAGVQRSGQLLFTSFWRETAIGWNQCDPL